MPGEPVGRRARRALELVGIRGEVPSGIKFQSFGLAGAVVGLQRQIGGTDDIAITDNHQERRRRYPFNE